MKLVRGSGDPAAETNVQAAYTSSGQKNRGASHRSWPSTSAPAQHASVTARQMLAAAIDNCSALTKPSRPATAAHSSRSRGGAPATSVSVVIY
jgi:hypothetical protein